MALKKQMTKDEIINFIDNELLPQTKQEIQNLIYPKKKQGGYFVVTRQILCMVDFLGATYSGYPKSARLKDKKDRKERIATSKKAKKFIVSFFEPKKIYRKNTVKILYDMYRHGLVHLYQPRILSYKNGTLDWFIYKGNRYQNKININNGAIFVNDVDHLKIIQFLPDKKKYHLAICIDALYGDFENAVIKYKNKLIQQTRLQSNWRTAVNSICDPR